MIAGVPAHVDGRMLAIAGAAGARADQLRPHVALHGGHPRTGRRSGPAMAFASCPARRPIGSTPPAAACRRRCFPASTRSARCATSSRPATTIRGSSPRRASPPRSSRCPAASRIRISPTKAGGRSSAARTKGMPDPVRAFLDKGEDFIVERDLGKLVARMNTLAGGSPIIDAEQLEADIRARDAQIDNDFGKDAQMTAIRAARAYRGDRLIRTAPPHKLLDPAARPARRGALDYPDPQDARRPADRPRRPLPRRGRCSPFPGSMPPARRPASAAAACTAMPRSRARSSAAASSPAATAGRAAARTAS